MATIARIYVAFREFLTGILRGGLISRFTVVMATVKLVGAARLTPRETTGAAREQ
jgi:hypothetical protein